MKRFLLLSLMVVSVAALLMGTAPGASASLVMTLDDLGTVGIDVIILDDADGGVGIITKQGVSNTTDTGAGDGLICFNGAVGVFSVNVVTGLSKPVIGTPDEALLHLNSINVSGNAGTLDIWLTDTDFFLPPVRTRMLSEIGGVTNTPGTIMFEQIFDLANNEFAIGPPAPDSVSIAWSWSGQGAFSDTAWSDAVDLGAGPFSLTEKVTIEHTAAGQVTSFDAQSSVPVPEPATMLLLGAGLVCFGVVGRKKLFKS